MDRLELYEKYKKLLHKLSSRYYKSLPSRAFLEYDDIFSLATIGLFKAYDYYDPSKGTNFMTYAFPTIRNTILSEIYGKSKTDIENKRLNLNATSLYAPIKEFKEIELIEGIEDPSNEIERIEDSIEINQAFIKVMQVIDNTLNYREKRILIDSYYYEKDLEEIAASWSIDVFELKRIRSYSINRLRSKAIIKEMMIDEVKNKISKLNEGTTNSIFIKSDLTRRLRALYEKQ